MKTLIPLLYFLCMAMVANANEDSLKQIKIPKNTFYPTIGTGLPAILFFTAGLNYERLLSRKLLGSSNNFYGRLTYGAWAAYGAGGTFYSVSAVAAFGRKSIHFDTSLGVGRIYDQIRHEGDPDHPPVGGTRKRDHTTTIPSASIGIRYQKPQGHFILKLVAGIPEGFHVGMGLCF